MHRYICDVYTPFLVQYFVSSLLWITLLSVTYFWIMTPTSRHACCKPTRDKTMHFLLQLVNCILVCLKSNLNYLLQQPETILLVRHTLNSSRLPVVIIVNDCFIKLNRAGELWQWQSGSPLSCHIFLWYTVLCHFSQKIECNTQLKPNSLESHKTCSGHISQKKKKL